MYICSQGTIIGDGVFRVEEEPRWLPNCNLDVKEGVKREITSANCSGEKFITGEKFVVKASIQESELRINDRTYFLTAN